MYLWVITPPCHGCHYFCTASTEFQCHRESGVDSMLLFSLTFELKFIQRSLTLLPVPALGRKWLLASSSGFILTNAFVLQWKVFEKEERLNSTNSYSDWREKMLSGFLVTQRGFQSRHPTSCSLLVSETWRTQLFTAQSQSDAFWQIPLFVSMLIL